MGCTQTLGQTLPELLETLIRGVFTDATDEEVWAAFERRLLLDGADLEDDKQLLEEEEAEGIVDSSDQKDTRKFNQETQKRKEDLVSYQFHWILGQLFVQEPMVNLLCYYCIRYEMNQHIVCSALHLSAASVYERTQPLFTVR